MNEGAPNRIQKYSGVSDCCSFRAYICILIMKNPVKVPLFSIRHLQKIPTILRVNKDLGSTLSASVLYNDFNLIVAISFIVDRI